MANKTPGEAQLSQYLLGKLSEAERESLEEEFFANDEVFEQMLIAEEELIDAYARGELAAEQHSRFEEIFLSSQQRRERVYFARDLVSVASDASHHDTVQAAKRTPRVPFLVNLRAQGVALRFALTAAALAIIIGFPWLFIERARMRTELRQLQNERVELLKKTQELEQQSGSERTQIENLLAQLESARAPRDKNSGGTIPSSVITFFLTPGLLRGSTAGTLNVPRDASSVILRLNVEAGTYASYRAVIETTGGREVWRADSVKPQRMTNAGGVVALPPLPAQVLPSGDYVLLLSGKQPDGSLQGVADYAFRVARK